MSKLTFRADEDLIDRVEALEASKSEVMRAALRRYLDAVDPEAGGSSEGGHGSIDALIAERVDTLVEQRLAARRQDIGLNITVSGETAGKDTSQGGTVTPPPQDVRADEASPRECPGCGEPVSSDRVYCPSCGESPSTRLICDCGDEIQLDWSFCPACGRRTPAAEIPDP